MIRNLKALGLALVAVCAMSAFAASAAQATPAEFSWDSGTTKLDAVNGGGDHVFTLTAGTVKCNTVTGHAAVSGTSAPSVTGTEITYDDTGGAADTCRGPLGSSALIEMNGCHYTFQAGTTVASAPNGHSTGTVDIANCKNADKSITVNAPGCVVHIPEQTGLGPVTYKTTTNGATGKEDVSVIASITNIKYKHTGFLCGNGEASNGSYSGNATITGTDKDGNATNVTVT
jgi:hypothetical protein